MSETESVCFTYLICQLINLLYLELKEKRLWKIL